ncbi:Retrovirus-related Pol polyprotein like [Argiope bruennichi]|uniref:Retrovirus-related Pol polyprotein like n=1 Tax=Argiope bruennichi TaxID=94029 RepID=A0A8T0EZK4_ARGBR|nr:Retrovirus-related Pol polyprotein like [Argiope bruennichi]
MSEIPKTYVETQNSPDKSKWDEAMSEEIEMMQSRKVWDLVEPNSNMKVLGCRFKNLPKKRVSLPFKVGCILPERVKENEIEETELMRQFPYRTLIGCLYFIANRSRPDIEFAVNTMSQFCNGYTYHHWTVVVDILNYVFETRHYKINLSDTRSNMLTMYSDSSWGCKLNDRHSTSGYIMFFGNVPIVWKSQKQKCIALSSMEAEFIALTESVKCIIWYSRILKELNLIDFEIPEVYCDNQAAIHFSKNNVENNKTKHIDIKYKFVQKLLSENEFYLKHINSKKNLADFLTKPLVKEKLYSVIKHIFKMDSVTDGAECCIFKSSRGRSQRSNIIG